jgi:hypothetical protein
MATIVSSQSLAAAATLTSSAYPFLPETVVIATITNGATPPNQQAKVQLQLSTDNVTYTVVDDRWAGAVPSGAYYHTFELSNYAGNNSSFGGGAPAPAAWLWYKLYFYNNDSQAVTVAASDGDQGNQAVVVLTGQANTNSGCQGSWTPTWPGPTIINNMVVIATNNAAAASSLFAGTANGATNNSANLINGAQLNAMAPGGVFSGANNSNVGNVLNANGSVVFTVNANAAGFLGKAYITYTKLT